MDAWPGRTGVTARRVVRFLAALLLVWQPGPSAGATPAQLALIVNERDPVSAWTGAYYARRRGIPPPNVITISLDPTQPSLTPAEFDRVRRAVLVRTPRNVQFYALTWLRPYRVACMSITSAMAFGFDPAYCAHGCGRTRLSPYFGSTSRRPWDDLGIRPTMSIAARSRTEARALIDRGIAADDTSPRGAAYLVRSGDPTRDVRAAAYDDARLLVSGRVPVRIEAMPGLVDRDDVMFYFIGAADVPGIETNTFLPGAVADHLTSLGGVLDGGAQMSSLRWLEAGVTGSYGTVVEPCNLPPKFPNPGLLMNFYLAGESLIEAYWKSVAMPGQGIFVGEPLARPFAAGATR